MHDINTAAKQNNILFFIFKNLLERTSVCLRWTTPKLSWAEMAQTRRQAVNVWALERADLRQNGLFVAPNSVERQAGGISGSGSVSDCPSYQELGVFVLENHDSRP
jgi:hypothetical protein